MLFPKTHVDLRWHYSYGWRFAIIVLVAIFFGVGCGGSSAPTSVSAAALEQNGEFWTELTTDLKRELIEEGKTKLGEERPDGASVIRAVSNDELIETVDEEFENQGKQNQTIYNTYVNANDQLASETFNELVPELESGP